MQKHKSLEKGFTAKYKITNLGYYEIHTSIIEAIEREKKIKGGSRQKKLDLITSINPEWKDLYEQLVL